MMNEANPQTNKSKRERKKYINWWVTVVVGGIRKLIPKMLFSFVNESFRCFALPSPQPLLPLPRVVQAFQTVDLN